MSFKLILFIVVFSFSQAALSQEPRFSAYKKQDVLLSFEKNCHGRKKIKRENKNAVTFTFFQDISDTVSIYVNEVKVAENYLFHDSTLVSTNYTGFYFERVYDSSYNRIRLFYHQSSSFIEFDLDRKYPLYSIHFYAPSRFYVLGRKCLMVIR
jgi:hypothetical protein